MNPSQLIGFSNITTGESAENFVTNLKNSQLTSAQLIWEN